MIHLLPMCNVSEKQHDDWNVESSLSEIPTSVNSIIISTALLFAVFAYIYKKCPYMTRISCTLCVLSYVSQFLPQFEDKNIKSIDDDFEDKHYFPYDIRAAFYYASLLKLNSKFIYSTFILSVIIRIWWCRKVSIIKDVSDFEREHLKDFARKQRKPVNKFIKKTINLKTNLKTPPVFPNGWFALLESKYLKIREAKPVFALGQSFAVFRGENGKAYVLDAICPHLGANISIGGQVQGNCLECPFHKWVFSGEDGVCVKVPYAEKKVPITSKIKTWPCCEKNGFIYVWYHAEGEPPLWHIPSIVEIEDGSWYFSGKTKNCIHCHIQEIPENAADMAHFKELHSDYAFDLQGYLFRKLWLLRHEWDATWKPNVEEGKTHTSLMNLKHIICLFSIPLSFTRLEADVQQIGPAIVYLRFRTILGNGIFIQNITPEKPLQQRMIHYLYTEFKFPQWFANIVLLSEDKMVNRDMAMWNHKMFLKNPTLLKEDKLINTFRRWYAQFYSKNSPTLESIHQENLDW